MMRNMAESDRLEQLSDQKRRRKLMEHRREIERLIEAQKAEKIRQKAEDAEFWAERKREEAEMAAVVEAERINLLKKHAEKLAGFLPGYLLRESDLELLGDDVRKSFQKRPYKDPLEELEAIYNA